ncbi:MAG: hypothetical protein V4655_04085 [Bdellovibrionota bacterium]
MKIFALIATALMLTACQHGFVPISQRTMFEKEGKSAALGHRRPIEESGKKGSEVYVKKEAIEIVPTETKNYTGSLLVEKSPNTYLFTSPPRAEVGEFLDVFVTVNRKDKAPAATAAPATPADPAAKGDQIQDELIAALPKLEPGTADAKMPSSIKMKVVKKLENGDVIVEAARASQNEWEANSQRATARIPYLKVQGEGEITTKDLADVHWQESTNGQITERESHTWEDEYSMRWAGFDEARSKVAIDLENKRKDLEKVKDRLRDKIVNVGRERNKLAVEKNKVADLRKEAEDKLNELSSKNAQQESQIEQQKDIIRKQEKIIEEAANAQVSLVSDDPKDKDKEKEKSKDREKSENKDKKEKSKPEAK